MTNATALAGGEEWHGVQSAADVAISATQMKTFAVTTPLAVVGNATAGAELRLPEDTDNGSNYIAIKAPDTIGSNLTYTLPATVTDGYVLSTNGSGTLSWVVGGGASAPLTLASGTITSSSPALTITQTWNNGATVFTALDLNIVTDTASDNSSKLLDLRRGGTTQFSVDKFGGVVSDSITNGANSQYFVSSRAALKSSCDLAWTSGVANGAVDTILYRNAAGIVGVRGATNSDGGALNFVEQTAPSAPSSNQVVIWAEDNGSGKTRLMARFATGANQQIAIEP
jgi:hypothetical protein